MGDAGVRAARYDDADPDDLARSWRVPEVHVFARVGSTNDVARALAAEGAPHGTVVVADEQSAGRGRSGRAWASPPGLGVWMSIVLRPASLPAPGLLPILVGLAAAEAMDRHAGPSAVRVKWPNDLQIGGRKLAGILCEATWDGAGPAFVVVGIGINVLHQPADFPPELRDTATSLRQEGYGGLRPTVAGEVVEAVMRRLAAPPAELDGALLAELAARDALCGRVVRVTGPEELTGTAEGISPAGALLVRTDGGLRAVTSGTVRPVEVSDRSSVESSAGSASARPGA